MQNGTTQQHTSAQDPNQGQRQESGDLDREDVDANENTRMIARQDGTQGDYMSMDSSSSDLRKSRGKGRRNSTATRRKSRRQSEQGENSSDMKRAGRLRRWWKHIVKSFANVELDNEGSVARDHLALERTYLAWLRTSISFASIGIAVTQLFRLNTSLEDDDNESQQKRLRRVGKPLGATFLGVATVVLFIGYHRYFESQHYVVRGRFPASRGAIIFVTLIAGALIFTSLVVIIAIAPKGLES